MLKQTSWIFPVALLLAGSMAMGEAPEAVKPAETMSTIGAGNVMGVYYAAASAVAKIANRKRAEQHRWLITAPTQGAVENIDSVLEGKYKFGMAQANMIGRAVRGTEPWTAPATNLQAVLGFYTEALTIVAAGDEGITGLAGLKGKRINVGAPGSGDAEYALPILVMAGVRPEDVTVLEEPSVKSYDLFESGKIDAYFFTDAHPALSIREAVAGKRKAQLLPLDPSFIAFIVASNPVVKAVTIPTDYYPELQKPEGIPSIGVKVVMFTRAGVDEETVYQIVKDVMTNLDLLRRQHPALAGLTAAEMARPAGLPLHPGAQRYFREAGLLP